jgi:hypothetical protein
MPFVLRRRGEERRGGEAERREFCKFRKIKKLKTITGL